MKLLIVLLAALLVAASASAQTITSTTVTVTNTTTGIQTTSTLTPANIACGQPKVVGALTTNARRIVWDDPLTPALDCIWTDPGTGVLLALPFGPASYTAVLRFANSVGTSAASAPSLPFTQPGLAPGVPTGVRVVN
jgi:hypothetical protein